MATAISPKGHGTRSAESYDLKAKDLDKLLEATVLETPKEESKELKTENCIHHWIIEPALGPTSKGICKYCGKERVFNNYWDEDAAKEKSNFLLGYKKWDRPSGRDRDAEFVKDIRHYVEKSY